METYVRDDGFSDMGGGLAAPATAPRRGSRQHFFHFLVGYLLPIVHQQTERPLPRFRVLECGPLMTGHMIETLRRIGWRFEVCDNRDITHPVQVPLWDAGWAPAARVHVRRAIDRVRDAWRSEPSCVESDCPHARNLLLVRSPAVDFYRPGGGAEISGYGSDRRCITNISEIDEHLRRSGIEHDTYEPGRHSLGCQIRAFGAAERIVGIRGAEWANMVWTSPGTRATILDPEPPARTLAGLLGRLGSQADFLVVERAHTEVDPEVVARALVGTT